MDVIPSRITTSIDVAQQYVHGLAPGSQKERFKALILDIRRGSVDSPLRYLKGVQPGEFACAQDYFTFAQFRGLVGKVPYKITDADRTGNAIASFNAAEARCRRTNKRLKHYLYGNTERMSPSVFLALWRAKCFISKHIGLLTDNAYNKVLDLSRPGPGLSLGTWNRYRTSPVYKYTATDPTCSEAARPVARDFFARNIGIARHYGEWTDGLRFRVPIESADNNRISFVPKDGLTLRSIAVEPNLNMQLQLGLHEYLKNVLGRIGDCDIQDQRRNQLLSKLGSTSTLGFATVDLSSASDTVSYELVRYLLPPDWFLLFDALRSPEYSLNGVRGTFSKFSSMGNGYTFALETLIFRALVEGVMSQVESHGVVAVYGDDIIIPQQGYALLSEVFSFCGFSINHEKSHCFGPFRESCGTDWYEGLNVTPVYLRKEVLTVRDVNRLSNEWKHSYTSHKVRDFLRRKLKACSSLVIGLENEDTGSCVFSSLNDVKETGNIRFSRKYQAYRFRGYQEIGIPDTVAPDWWRYLNSLYGGSHDLTLRGRTRVRLRWLSPGRKVREWYE